MAGSVAQAVVFELNDPYLNSRTQYAQIERNERYVQRSPPLQGKPAWLGGRHTLYLFLCISLFPLGFPAQRFLMEIAQAMRRPYESPHG